MNIVSESQLTLLIRGILQSCLLFPFLKQHCISFEISGLENLESLNGPSVFVANHSSHADVAIILCALPLRLRMRLAIAAAADYFYEKKKLGAVVTLLLNTFPFERCHPRQGLQQGKHVLQTGQSLLIFPEGTRTNPECRAGFKRGFAALACQMKVPIVPIYICGSHEMLPKGSSWPRKAAVHISFGEALMPEGKSSAEIAHIIEAKVKQLAFVA
jgi:1-acyl-sn-glycerol-3-phosphate acyltransferase